MRTKKRKDTHICLLYEALYKFDQLSMFQPYILFNKCIKMYTSKPMRRSPENFIDVCIKSLQFQLYVGKTFKAHLIGKKWAY